jgi:hypothetical protein
VGTGAIGGDGTQNTPGPGSARGVTLGEARPDRAELSPLRPSQAGHCRLSSRVLGTAGLAQLRHRRDASVGGGRDPAGESGHLMGQHPVLLCGSFG